MGRPSAALRLASFVLAGIRLCIGGYVPPLKYLIVSNAANGTIGYAMLPRFGQGNVTEVRTLIDTELRHPQGIAVDQKRQLLLVADSDLRKVVSYGLTVHEDGSLGVDDQSPVAEDIETRWVAVDGLGNVFMTDEQRGQLLKITVRQVLEGETTAAPVFTDAGASVASPGGIVTDNFNVYWTNKQNGESVGTVVKSLASPTNESALQPVVLARNLPKAYGLCLALDSVYFTDVDHNVYAVKVAGGDPVRVNSQFANPRGCAWDGESTVYVADRSADGVFALGGQPAMALGEVPATRALNFEGAFGVAVFSSARRRWDAAVVALSAAWILAASAAAVGRE